MAHIIVAGGGPSGCAFAVAARALGHEVVVLHDGRRLRSWPGESLPAGGGELVASVFGADVLLGHAPAFGTVAAWGSPELVSHDYMTHWSGRGWHLDRERFDAQLREAATAHGCEVVPERLTSLQRMPGGWRVNERWVGDWVVDATGRAGALAARLGITRIVHDEQIALLAVLADLGGERVTTVESVRYGWWYSTPLAGQRRVVALITDPDLLETDRHDTWRSGLKDTEHMQSFVSGDPPVAVHAYPAGTSRRASIVGDGWLAVGDAAVSFDPLSSQGLITGIVMGARAASALATGLDVWAAEYDALLDEHLRARADLYRAEQRWPDASFWCRRRR